MLLRFAVVIGCLLFLASCGGNPEANHKTRGSGAVPRTMSFTDASDAAYEDLVQQLYIAYFGRPADPAGLVFYAHAYHAANAPTTIGQLYAAYGTNQAVRDLVDSFAWSQESNQLYNMGSNIAQGFVSAVYDNMFSRQPDKVGGEFWERVLRDGVATRANVALSIMAGAAGSDAELITRKLGVAKQFTQAIDAGGNRAIYTGNVPNLILRAMIRSVPAMPDAAAVQASITATTLRLSSLASGQYEEIAPGTHNILLLASTEQAAANGARIAALASALAVDLNQLRPGGQAWSVQLATAAATVPEIRDQLRPYNSALLIGRVPVPELAGGAKLDLYRLPDCPFMRADSAGTVTAFSDAGVDPRCKNGRIISILRGTSAQTDITEVAGKLDQMIAYHKASSAANGGWAKTLRYIGAAWFGGDNARQQGQLDAWTGMTMYAQGNISDIHTGSGAQRRDSFVDCITNNNEACIVNLHGAPTSVAFEGPGAPGVFYSSDSVDWSPADLGTQSVKAKYLAFDSCSTHALNIDGSIGTSLLMRGNALLTRGNVVTSWIDNHREEDDVRQEFAMLQDGSTFAEALFARMEGTPGSIQGDPYITMRPAPTGKLPKLVIDGKHYNSGAVAFPVDLPDSVDGTKLSHVITYSNRGDADLHLRLAVVPSRIGFDNGSPQGYQAEGSDGSVIYIEFLQTYSDGVVLAWPQFETETFTGAMHATLRPGQSVAVIYRLNVPVGADGKPLRTGRQSWEIVNTSDDPGSKRVIMTMTARIR